MAQLVGLSEIAERFGISPQLAHTWAEREDFPKPTSDLPRRRLWEMGQVEKWAKTWEPSRRRFDVIVVCQHLRANYDAQGSRPGPWVPASTVADDLGWAEGDTRVLAAARLAQDAPKEPHVDIRGLDIRITPYGSTRTLGPSPQT